MLSEILRKPEEDLRIVTRGSHDPYLIRIEDRVWYQGEDGEICARIFVNHLRITRRTKCGCFVMGSDYREHFVLDGGDRYKKRYAYEDIDTALRAYLKRKHWQRWHGEQAIKHAEVGIRLAGMLEAQLKKDRE